MVPSYDMTAPGFEPARYWRGPSWFNMAWLMIQALRSRELSAEAATVAAQARRLAVTERFPEYVDPLTGSAHGTRSFSWTAALSLDLELNEKSVLP
jgi:glycogen debranching enzyme